MAYFIPFERVNVIMNAFQYYRLQLASARDRNEVEARVQVYTAGHLNRLFCTMEAHYDINITSCLHHMVPLAC
jgi:uncharacterized protein YbgA (DUF1722 family)